MHFALSYFLNIENAGISKLISQRKKKLRMSLYTGPPTVERKVAFCNSTSFMLVSKKFSMYSIKSSFSMKN